MAVTLEEYLGNEVATRLQVLVEQAEALVKLKLRGDVRVEGVFVVVTLPTDGALEIDSLLTKAGLSRVKQEFSVGTTSDAKQEKKAVRFTYLI